MIINRVPQSGFGATFERMRNMSEKQKKLFYYINRYMDYDTQQKLENQLGEDIIILARPSGKDKVSLQALVQHDDDDGYVQFYNFANGKKYSTGGFGSENSIMKGFKNFLDELVESISYDNVQYDDKYLVKKQPDVVYLPMH